MMGSKGKLDAHLLVAITWFSDKTIGVGVLLNGNQVLGSWDQISINFAN